MPESKKVLVAFDPSNPNKQSSDFLIPIYEDGQIKLLGTKSKLFFEYGMVVLTSRLISEEDLLKKLEDIGNVVTNKHDVLPLLASFLNSMKTVKIGNIVKADLHKNEVKLNVVAITPSAFEKKFSRRN